MNELQVKNRNMICVISYFLPFYIFYVFVFQNTFIIVGSLAIYFFCALFFFFIFKINRAALFWIIFVFLVCFVGMFKVSHGVSKVFYLIQFVLLLMLGNYISMDIRRYYNSIRCVFYSFLILSYYVLISNFGRDEPLSYFIEGSSQNGIPSYLLIALLSYLFCSLVLFDRLPIIPAFLCLVISFYGEGRGSLVVSIFVLFICLAYSIMKPNAFKGWQGVVTGLLMFILILFIYINFEVIYDFIVLGSKLSVGLNDANRLGIFYSYIDTMSYIEVLLGGSYEDNIISSKYLGNPHIAYVRLHAFFGLIPLVFVLLSPFFIFRGNVKAFFCFSLAFLFLIRAISEPVLFPTSLDFFYFMSFYIYFKYKKQLL